MPLGYRKPVLFDRQAVGGEYGAGYKYVGKGRLVTLFLPEKGATPTIVDGRILLDEVGPRGLYRSTQEIQRRHAPCPRTITPPPGLG